MSVITQSANFAQATRKVGDRQVSYTWRSPSQSIQFDDEQVGGLVELRMSHDSARKELRAFIRYAHYNRERGYEIVKFTMFDAVNYPSGTVATESIARYSAKALSEFENRVINYLSNGLVGAGDQVREVWKRATLISMGGDGTHGA